MNIHGDLSEVFASLPPIDWFSDIKGTRAATRELLAANQPPADPRISVRDTSLPGAGGSRIPVRIYTPADAEERTPAVLYCHGGAFVTGDLDTGDSNCREICLGGGAVVVSVAYRLAPEHPFPAGLDDCYAALCWLADHAAELGVDPARIGISGRSAGGCIAAAVALRARDEDGPTLIHQLLLVPVLDDRCQTPSARAMTDPRALNRDTAQEMWRTYLGPEYLGAEPPASNSYAAPGRWNDLTGLPAAYILVAENDPLRDEGLDYGRRLVESGVSTELHLVPGAFHLFEAYAPNSALTRRTTRHWMDALHSALRQ
ncbi:alpha/beta hydrolase [Streptomyces sp. NBC_01304]|uniref:alpha/beta hydrolase n=1 Tax=Streptomyces sp. NBC_01304 TaxID=2903818 RepID=UPI002E132E04|nr:alpha/beta hydrolase [Streptomyces sp. NBC_01304]